MVVFHALRGCLPDQVVRRLDGKRPVLIVLRLPAADWIGSVERGFMRALEQRLKARWLLPASAVTLLPGGGFKASWDKKTAKEKMGSVLGSLEDHTTVLTLMPGETMDPSLRAFADLEIDVTITSDHFRQMLVDHFVDGTAIWPADIPASSIDPAWIDAAVHRADTTAEVVSVVQAAVTAGARSSKVRLEDLNGYGAAKEWGLTPAETATLDRLVPNTGNRGAASNTLRLYMIKLARLGSYLARKLRSSPR